MEFLLYNFYYRTLPELFFSGNDYWLNTADLNALFEELLVLWENEVYDNGNPETDLYAHRIIQEKILSEELEENGFFLLLELEKPAEPTIPLYLALVELKHERYFFTYELQADFSGEEKEKFVFGAWLKNGTHVNRGTHSNTSVDYFRGLVLAELKIL
ncbi:MAG: hypothetical protein IAF38_16385 [Bacteroidia bacterium]|nr:hypothetical protein [Bacteroidia bacterium]